MGVEGKRECPYVVCPFYSFDDSKQKINCEGMTNRSTVIHRFQTRLHWDKHMKKFCCDHPEDCPWYKTLMETKYKGSDD